MFNLFLKGGPLMWPLLLTSLVTVTIVVERILFIVKERKRRRPDLVRQILANVEKGDVDAAIACGKESDDFVVKTLVYGLSHREGTFSEALMLAANQELKRFNYGLSALDTAITLAPLLGLLGTVTGLIHAFGLLKGAGLDAPAVITGGIAEALIATGFGLAIAIIALIPFNYLNARLEEARRAIEDSATYLEILLARRG